MIMMKDCHEQQRSNLGETEVRILCNNMEGISVCCVCRPEHK
jgi:hypothetical protein